MKKKFATLLKNKKAVAIIAACLAVIVIAVIIVCVVTHNKKVAAANNITVPVSEETTLPETTTILETTAEATTAEVTTETTAKATKENTTKVKTTEKSPDSVAKKNTTAAQTTTKKNLYPVSFLVTGPVPFPKDSDGGFSLSNLNAGNMREDPNGGYLFDVWGTLYNNHHNDYDRDEEINAKIDFYVITMGNEHKTVAHGILNAGVLQPGENKYVVTTVHVDEYNSYMVNFGSNSWR